LASVTRDGHFTYVQVGSGHVTCKREGNRIVLIAATACQLTASGGLDIVTVAVSRKKDEKPKSDRFAANKPPELLSSHGRGGCDDLN
jgi:hypothetical protein